MNRIWAWKVDGCYKHRLNYFPKIIWRSGKSIVSEYLFAPITAVKNGVKSPGMILPTFT